MIQTARLLRWTNTSIKFWKRSDAITPREIQFSLLSVNNSCRSDKQTYNDQIAKLSYDYMPKNIKRGRLQQAIYLYAQWMQKYVGLIEVQSNWLLIWNIINYFGMGIILVQLLFILIDYTQKQTIGFNPVTEQLFFIVFILDMIFVRHRVPLFIKGKFLKDPVQLLKRYLKSLILIDLITIILLVIKIGEVWEWEFVKVLMFLKYLTGRHIDKQIQYKLISYRVILALYSFFKYIMGLIFWTTLYACLYVIIDYNYIYQGSYYYQEGMVWLTASPNLNNINLYEQFSWEVWFEYALFYILQTIRGCGYGIATPRNPVEVLFANISMLTLMALFSYFTKQIIDISVNYSIDKEQLLAQATSNLRNIQGSYDISESHTLKYLEQITRKQKKEQTVLQQLAQSHFSDDLRNKFIHNFRKTFILAQKFLYSISEDGDEGLTFRMEMSQVIQSKKSFKGEYFYRRGIISEEILYLSQEGRIILKNQELGIVSKTHNWDFVGVREFFIDKKSIFDVISMATLKIFYLRKKQFMQILKKYRRIYERYCQEIDFIKFNRGNTQKLNLVCLNCKRYHLFEECFLFNSYKENVILLRENRPKQKQQDSSRKSYKRSRIVSEKMRVKLQVDQTDCFYLSKEQFSCYNI